MLYVLQQPVQQICKSNSKHTELAARKKKLDSDESHQAAKNAWASTSNEPLVFWKENDKLRKNKAGCVFFITDIEHELHAKRALYYWATSPYDVRRWNFFYKNKNLFASSRKEVIRSYFGSYSDLEFLVRTPKWLPLEQYHKNSSQPCSLLLYKLLPVKRTSATKMTWSLSTAIKLSTYRYIWSNFFKSWRKILWFLC